MRPLLLSNEDEPSAAELHSGLKAMDQISGTTAAHGA
jgi:hypothetical protein